MTIVDPKFGGEIITKKGKVYKFDDMVCMIQFLKSGKVRENEIAKKLVINFQKPNDFIDVNKAFVLVSPELKTPMGGNAGAFISQHEAEKIKPTAPGDIINWNEMFNKLE